MAEIRVLVLRAPGINCDEETAHAWSLVGARAERLHIDRLIERPARLGDYQVLTLPGGFSYGDDIAAGRILANRLRLRLGEAIDALLARGGLVLGICNGFQVLVRMGLLPGRDGPPPVSLTHNDSGRYEDRWVHVRSEASHCPFLDAGAVYHLPVAHAEGKLVVAGGARGAAALAEQGRIALRYVDPRGGAPVYPHNPNGSVENIAALTDSTGRVFGLMPHPERSVAAVQSPAATRPISPDSGGAGIADGLRLFRAALRHFA